MKHLYKSLTLLMVIALSSSLTAQDVRSLWVWGSSSSIIQTPHVRDAFFDFCDNPPGFDDPNAIEGFPRAINVVYLSANYHLSDTSRHAVLRDFLRRSHERGIKVEYLDGAANWATTNMQTGKNRMDNFYNFQLQTVDPVEQFDGVQYDVEPYLLPGWSNPDEKMKIWEGYIEMMTYCQTLVDSLKDSTYFGSAIPRWFDNNPGVQYLHQLQDLIDYVAIMDYVDSGRRLISDAGAEVLYANQIGKKVIVGVEAQKIDPPTSTFYEEGWGNMENDLYEVYHYFKDYSSFDGIAIHHYDYYKNFPKYGTGGMDIHPPKLLGSSFVQNDSSQHEFHFNIIDLTGSGIDTAKIIESAVVFYEDSEFGDTLTGTWYLNSSQVMAFRPSPGYKSGNYTVTLTLHDSAGNSINTSAKFNITVSSVNSSGSLEDMDYELLQNYPNPFNPSTKVEFTIIKSGFTALRVYDVLGTEVQTLVSKQLNPGRYTAVFNGSSLPSGIYFYVLNTNNGQLTKKMMLVK